MSLRPIDLTTALRPALLPDEILLFVQDAVGLYAGKAKLAGHQNGHAYLTSHRACYVDNERPRRSPVAVYLRDVERCELHARFLRSSPKVTLTPKAAKFPHQRQPNIEDAAAQPLASRQTHGATLQQINATWVCPICSFSNPVPTNFDPGVANDSAPIPPCLSCGIRPPLVNVVKAAIASMSDRHAGSLGAIESNDPGQTVSRDSPYSGVESSVACPRCTFLNHPSLPTCEVCGVALPRRSHNLSSVSTTPPGSRSESPAPPDDASTSSINFSFRDGGEKIFLERLKSALVQKKWLLQSAPPVPQASKRFAADRTSGESGGAGRGVGIAGLEQRGLETRKNNEVVIGNAFEDLAALMASAKDIIALAETFASQVKPSSGDSTPYDSSGDAIAQDPAALLSQLNLTTTKDMLSSTTSSLYHSELARSLAEFLTDDSRGVLRSSGGIMTLVDLWALFNRARGGVELVSPTDFAAAAELFETLGLPVRLRRFKSGVCVVQERGRTEERTIAALTGWLAQLREDGIPHGEATSWDWNRWGSGVTAQECAERFGWSVGVAVEELEMAEEKGALCRESCLEGVRFWENWFVEA